MIDNETWALMQRRIVLQLPLKLTNEHLAVSFRDALQANPLATNRDLRALGLPSKETIRARLGPWADCLRQAGHDPEDRRRSYIERAAQRRVSSRLVVLAIAEELRKDGHLIAFDGRLNVFDFPEFSIRLRVLWPTLGKGGQGWRFRAEPISRDVDFDLVVRMGGSIRPMDYFIVLPCDFAVRFPRWLSSEIPVELQRFWYRSPVQLLEQIKAISEQSVARSC